MIAGELHKYSKTPISNHCAQSPSGLYDRNSLDWWVVWKRFQYWATTCQMWPATTRIACREPFTWSVGPQQSTYVWHLVGLCKLWTTFCVNFETQRCNIHMSLITATSVLWLFNFKLKRTKCLPWYNIARFKDHLLFKAGFCCTKGWS